MTINYPKDFFGHPQANTLLDINITREDIICAIKTISQNSYGGPDEFPAIFLSKSFAHPLQLLYKASLNTWEIPVDLKRVIITTIYQGGSRNLSKNYRLVALTSRLLNILEKILVKYFHKFLEKHQKMNHTQQGFRPGWSCLSLLLEHHYQILEELEESNNVDVIYLDNDHSIRQRPWHKAFDKVDHGILLNKLKKSELKVKSVCGYTIFSQTYNNVLPPMEQHQVTLKSEVAYLKD